MLYAQTVFLYLSNTEIQSAHITSAGSKTELFGSIKSFNRQGSPITYFCILYLFFCSRPRVSGFNPTLALAAETIVITLQ